MKKVSIITPCYNGEKYINRYLDSIIAQTYDNIELVLINDGSTDKTEEVIFKYKEKLKKRGYDFLYLKQENKGQAAATNFALKKFTGDYLTLIDSDDFIHIDSIRKKVEFLDKNIEYGLVRTDGYFFSENDLIKPLNRISNNNPNRFNESIFDDLFWERTFVSNGCYMLRTNSFLEVNPNRNIYVSRGGQNWQMILPIAQRFKCGFIDEPLFNCIVRTASHSRDLNNDFELELIHLKNLKDILINVIDKIDIDNERYLKLIDIKYLRREMRLGFKLKNRAFARERYDQLKNIDKINMQDRLYMLLGMNRVSNFLLDVRNKIRN